MDIITHTLSGMAAGSCLAFYSKNGWKEKAGIILLSGLGSAIPDIDTISMWSGFNATFGKLFHLPHSGRAIYSSKLLWYSHHGFMHSLAGGVLFTFILALILYIIMRGKKKKVALWSDLFVKKRLLLLGFLFGFILHAIEDMFTPAGSWGGVRIFFPSTVYIGGTGNIWWWNNYDVFLLFTFVLATNLLLLLFGHLFKKDFRRWGTGLFIAGLIVVAVQIKTRGFDFNAPPHETCEAKSKQIQRELLGETLYRKMERFDSFVKVHF